MMPSIASFTDELVKIAWEAPTKDELKDLARNVAIYGGGLAVGGGLGYAAREKVLPYLLQHMSPAQAKALTYGSGALAGLAGAAAMKKALTGLGQKEVADES